MQPRSITQELCDMQMWLIPKDSAAYDYTIPDDDIFYIMATSGIYANQSDAFDDLTTNWIGVSHVMLHWVVICHQRSKQLATERILIL